MPNGLIKKYKKWEADRLHKQIEKEQKLAKELSKEVKERAKLVRATRGRAAFQKTLFEEKQEVTKARGAAKELKREIRQQKLAPLKPAADVAGKAVKGGARVAGKAIKGVFSIWGEGFKAAFPGKPKSGNGRNGSRRR
jgi:hypothetical protein